MRALLLAMMTACMIGGSDNRPVTARPAPDPDRMPSETLDRQAPGADTSNNPVLSRSEACSWFQRNFTSCDEPLTAENVNSLGCRTCTTGGSADASMLGSLAVLAVITRRRRKSPRRNKS